MSLPWYKEGLRFKCTGCGKCCTGFPGYVWLTEEDIDRLAKKFELPRAEFLYHYTRQVGKRYSLKEKGRDHCCILLENKKICTAYEARPKQCRTFPWWTENLENRDTWNQVKRHCEGIDAEDAPLVSCEEIQKQMN